SFTGPWMDYIFPRMILRSDDKKTLAVGLYEMISGRSNDNFTMFAAGAILVAVPFAILFMAGQKSLLLSLAGTSGKE
ncbi:MAG: sugar ABC transporter permease, partial [Treponema porcinum]|nr:sugar ABC transporter permease [Treponema porcinum]